MGAQPQTSLTPQQYLERERAADFKSEYFAGQMYAMSGGSFRHARIATNMMVAFHGAIGNSPCVVASSDLRVRVSPDGLYTYPDAVVICQEPKFADDQQDTLVNPKVIIEVLSPVD